MEELLYKILNDIINNLNNDKEQINKEIELLSNKKIIDENGNYTITKEEQELIEDRNKIENETSNIEKTKRESQRWHKQRNDIQEEQKKLLRNKGQLEKEIRGLQGKYIFENEKMVKPRELVEYEKDFNLISDRILKNENKLKRLNNSIEKLYEKYNVEKELKSNELKEMKEKASKETNEEQFDKKEKQEILDNTNKITEHKISDDTNHMMGETDAKDLETDQKDIYSPKDFGKYKIVPQSEGKLEPLKTKKSEEKQKNDDKKAEIMFDISRGEYIYIPASGDGKIEEIFDEYGKERLSPEDKEDIKEDLIEAGLNIKTAKRVDPYIYAILTKYKDYELRDQYVAALDENLRGMKDLNIKYDLRTKINGKKKEKIVDYTFKEKMKINRIARYHGKKGIAEVLRTKSKAKFYGILAALGIGAVGTGVYQLSKPNNTENQIETEFKGNENDSPIIIIDQNETENELQTEMQTNTEKQSESQRQSETEKQTNNNSNQSQVLKPTEVSDKSNTEMSQKDVRIGTYVTVRTGAHLYDDPYDAVKEQLQRTTNGKIVVKTKNADRVYKVTKEGLYCPDGRCVEISNGDLETAMKKAGIDINILKNIDTKTLEKQGYKRMLHVVADGIAQWVEEGDSMQLQADKFGNRVEKTEAEKQIDQNTSSNQQSNEEKIR